ncbi:MAG TPA: hypothetical protein PLV92_24550, partial [Pirellulaceae bacterium]|nr:hypothetical protein [Pirellulaceae bacterium]
GDAAMLAETGFPALEKGLEEFLVGNRFRGKLVKAMVQVRATNVDCQSLLDNRERLARTSLDELQARYERAREPLARLKQRSDLIIGRVEAGLQGLLRSVADRAQRFLIGCPSRVEGWLEGYVSTKSISWNPLKIKSSATELAEEYLGQMKNQFQLDASGWASSDLFPWLDAEITRLFQGVDTLTRDYNLALNEVQIMLAPDMNGAQIGANQDSSAASKLGGLIYGVITHDWLNAGMVGVFGVKGLMRGLATQFAAGIVLGLVSLLTPVGWVGILAAVIAAGTVSAAWNLASLSAAVKKQVIESVARSLRDGAEQQRMVSNIQGEVEKQFSRLLESMRAAAAADLNLVESEVQKALAEKKSGEQAIEQDRRRLSELSRANREVAVSIVDLAIDA